MLTGNKFRQRCQELRIVTEEILRSIMDQTDSDMHHIRTQMRYDRIPYLHRV